MKKIEDYLHLYIGCEVAAPNPYDDHGVEIAKGLLTGIHGEYGPEIQFIIDGNAEEAPDYVEFIKVKPILRRLSSMTEEEMRVLYHLMGEPDNTWHVPVTSIGFWSVIAGYQPNIIDVRFSGSVGAGYTSGHSRILLNRLNAESFQHLLSKGFDLFGLIDVGLAIDESTL